MPSVSDITENPVLLPFLSQTSRQTRHELEYISFDKGKLSRVDTESILRL